MQTEVGLPLLLWLRNPFDIHPEGSDPSTCFKLVTDGAVQAHLLTDAQRGLSHVVASIRLAAATAMMGKDLQSKHV